jgi:hypothetical protein
MDMPRIKRNPSVLLNGEDKQLPTGRTFLIGTVLVTMGSFVAGSDEPLAEAKLMPLQDFNQGVALDPAMQPLKPLPTKLILYPNGELGLPNGGHYSHSSHVSHHSHYSGR